MWDRHARIGLAVRTVAAIVLLPLIPVVADAQQTSVSPGATVTVTGHGEARRAPQSVVVRAIIMTNDDIAEHATGQNQTMYDAVVAKLAAQGIDAKNIRTENFSVNNFPRPVAPVRQPGQPATPVIGTGARFGYSVSRVITISGIDPEAVGRIADALIAAGAGNVNAATSQIAGPVRDEAYRTLLAAAVNDAAVQAQALAAAAHRHLGPIVQMQAGSQTIAGFYPIRTQAVPVNATQYPQTAITANDVEIRADVVVTYALR